MRVAKLFFECIKPVRQFRRIEYSYVFRRRIRSPYLCGSFVRRSKPKFICAKNTRLRKVGFICIIIFIVQNTPLFSVYISLLLY